MVPGVQTILRDSDIFFGGGFFLSLFPSSIFLTGERIESSEKTSKLNGRNLLQKAEYDNWSTIYIHQSEASRFLSLQHKPQRVSILSAFPRPCLCRGCTPPLRCIREMWGGIPSHGLFHGVFHASFCCLLHLHLHLPSTLSFHVRW